MAKTKQLQIRPYARLLTMLGEQLIKNERIALIELIKNSYDADATWVKISFLDFGSGYKITPNSKIVIEDNGHGMTSYIIEKHWLNPATPEKKLRKAKKNTTKNGRVIQGDKGIGRFSMLKLGSTINIITRAKDDINEHVIKCDFSIYDNEFLSENGKEKELFIDDLSISLMIRKPVCFIEKKISLGTRKVKSPPHGTIIEISSLKGSWSEQRIKDVYTDIARLQSIFVEPSDHKNKNRFPFDVFIYKNNEKQDFEEKYFEKLHFLLDERAVIRVENGVFSEDGKVSFIIDGTPFSIDIFDPDFTGVYPFKKRFGDAAKVLRERELECGPFKFGFYIFDLSKKAPAKYSLDQEDKKILKSHRVYLYRDGIRVYPYGDPEDDWLCIDIMRGTISAGQFFSNDQIVGYVNITQKENSKLKDKTNREGLIEEGNATLDFITIIQNILSYLRAKPFKRYQINQQEKKSQDIFRTEQIQEELDKLKNVVGDNKKARNLIANVEKDYKAERRYLIQRAETTEELAGVGLSVETASHDIMGIMGKVFTNLDGLIHDLVAGDEINKDELLKELQTIRGGMSFIEAQLKDIQLLFKSSKQRRKNIRVKDILEKVERIYRRFLKKESINFSINSAGSPLVAKTTDAVLLQLLLNLFDNSVYWLKQTSRSGKKIEVLLDGNKGQMVFSDNGPGIDKDDTPYIFEPFYSGKGEDGRGLGLYIARQLLERSDYSIELSELKSEKVLQGANFVINFVAEEK